MVNIEWKSAVSDMKGFSGSESSVIRNNFNYIEFTVLSMSPDYILM
jgi:hypothetical protein